MQFICSKHQSYQIILLGSILIYVNIAWYIEFHYLTDANNIWKQYFKSDIAKYADLISSVIGCGSLSLSIVLILSRRKIHLRLVFQMRTIDESLGTFIDRNTTDMDTSLRKRWLIACLAQLLLVVSLIIAFNKAMNKFPFWFYLFYKSVKTFVSCTISVYIQHLARILCERLILLAYQFHVDLNIIANECRRKQRIAQAIRLFYEFADLNALFGKVFGSQLLVNFVVEFLMLTVTLFTRIVNVQKRNGLKCIDVFLLLSNGLSVTVNCVLVCCLISGISAKVLF